MYGRFHPLTLRLGLLPRNLHRSERDPWNSVVSARNCDLGPRRSGRVRRFTGFIDGAWHKRPRTSGAFRGGKRLIAKNSARHPPIDYSRKPMCIFRRATCWPRPDYNAMEETAMLGRVAVADDCDTLEER